MTSCTSFFYLSPLSLHCYYNRPQFHSSQTRRLKCVLRLFLTLASQAKRTVDHNHEIKHCRPIVRRSKVMIIAMNRRTDGVVNVVSLISTAAVGQSTRCIAIYPNNVINTKYSILQCADQRGKN